MDAKPQLWTPRDLERLRQRGIPLEEAQRQLQIFLQPPRPLHLDRPCTLGDGIRRIDANEESRALRAYERARLAGRITKFVPASGAASRMFASLQLLLRAGGDLQRTDLHGRDDAVAREVRLVLDSLHRFAFFPALRESLTAAGHDVEALLQGGPVRPILQHLTSRPGLDLASLPKGLLPFHQHPDRVRSAFEEHLIEAAATIADADGRCRIHFTVAPDCRSRFEALLAQVRPDLEERHGVRFDVGFSSQKPSTDTIAVDLENRPFRDSQGELLLRPGGHGALLENLDDLDADLVAMKNIDNVTFGDDLTETIRWKKILGGILCLLQERLFTHVAKLRSGSLGEQNLESAWQFARHELTMEVPAALAQAGPEVQRQFLLEKLQRPVRVCGMVRNTGEPGGGPFWVRDADGRSSLQIVERAQIDTQSAEQQRIFESSTHFSPVDLVCGLRDSTGCAYDLRHHVDPQAIFIARKTHEGRKLRALEHPGLWNGGMAHWITLLVEVPDRTFNPVKTLTDLLRPGHQPR